ncbi:Hypothetical protein, putative [Bodo saltans]|uniref:PIN domain-containing protein n=1 Tax=Bodo saltans TaxID=75058 RepID=A0A0S4JQ65_BODSA|nr:Hypothetical protein, putative [Bodo saltans]|eukprot:CUG93682.1 Hypothetical protein, putative [Bodo saltans]
MQHRQPDIIVPSAASTAPLSAAVKETAVDNEVVRVRGPLMRLPSVRCWGSLPAAGGAAWPPTAFSSFASASSGGGGGLFAAAVAAATHIHGNGAFTTTTSSSSLSLPVWPVIVQTVQNTVTDVSGNTSGSDNKKTHAHVSIDVQFDDGNNDDAASTKSSAASFKEFVPMKRSRYEKQMEAVQAHERRKERREERRAAAAEEQQATRQRNHNGNNDIPYDEELGHLLFDPVGASSDVVNGGSDIGNEGGHRGDKSSSSLVYPSWVDLPVGALPPPRSVVLPEFSLRCRLTDDRHARQRQQIREDERRLGLWRKHYEEQDSKNGGSHDRNSAEHHCLDAKEAAVAAALDALMRSVYTAGWRPRGGAANNTPAASLSAAHLQQQQSHNNIHEVLSKLPTGVVMVFDTSSLISASRWVDVLELLMSLGNTIVVPPTVLHELDFTIKRWRAKEHQIWIAQRNAEEQQQQQTHGNAPTMDQNEQSRASFSGGGHRGRGGRGGSANSKRPRSDDDDHHHLNPHQRRRDVVDENLAKRALVLRDWLSLQRQEEEEEEESPGDRKIDSLQRKPPTVDDGGDEDDSYNNRCGRNNNNIDEEEQNDSSRNTFLSRFAPGRATVAGSLDTIETIWRQQQQQGEQDIMTAILPPHNNDDRILRVAMYFSKMFLSMPLQPSSSDKDHRSSLRRRRPVLLVTDDRILALKARSEQVAVATSIQLLQWK